MKNVLKQLLAVLVLFGVVLNVQATPEEDREIFQRYNQERFPNVPFQEFANGSYSFDEAGRENWEAMRNSSVQTIHRQWPGNVEKPLPTARLTKTAFPMVR